MTEPKKPAAEKPVAKDTVRVRVLKKGDGRVYKGNGEKYAKGDEFDAPVDIAANLEDAGLVDTL